MKTVVITGANRGIGFTTAKLFLKEGWQVIGTSRSGQIDIKDKNLKVIKLDLNSSESITNAAKTISKLKGGVDVLVNNAGMRSTRDNKISVTGLRETLEVNLIGLIDLTEKLVPTINDDGHIINISSELASFKDTWSLAPAYRISKAAVNMYTRTLVSRLGSKNITVSSLDPGWVRTDMGGSSAPRKPEEAAKDIFKLATRKDVETGQFWLQGKKREW
jgi:NAD(P)-dependent dehydrogenase (short-subunit alcohol dehydrogenase family)